LYKADGRRIEESYAIALQRRHPLAVTIPSVGHFQKRSERQTTGHGPSRTPVRGTKWDRER
jgi:hypothetical protein